MRHSSRTLRAVREQGAFGVSVLRDRHRAVSEACAGAGAEPAVAYRREAGVPVIEDALAWLSCRLHAEFPGGDHVIVVGAVTAVSCDAGEPLVWHRSAYRTLIDLEPARM